MDANQNTNQPILNQTNYQAWQQHSKEPRILSSMNKFNSTFSNGINQSFQITGNHSPDFKHKKNESYNYTRQPSSTFLQKENNFGNNSLSKTEIYGSLKENENSRKSLKNSPSKAVLKDET